MFFKRLIYLKKLTQHFGQVQKLTILLICWLKFVNLVALNQRISNFHVLVKVFSLQLRKMWRLSSLKEAKNLQKSKFLTINKQQSTLSIRYKNFIKQILCKFFLLYKLHYSLYNYVHSLCCRTIRNFIG